MTGAPVPPGGRCAALANALDLDLDSSGVCLACLSFVSIPLADGDDATALEEVRRLAPELWHDGLSEPLVAALTRAHGDGVPGSEAALDDVLARGPRSSFVRAVVLRLAAELAEQARAEYELVTRARSRAPRGAPELN